MVGFVRGRSLAFRLWLTLSLAFLAMAAIALPILILVLVRSDIEHERQEVETRHHTLEVMETMTVRIIAATGRFEFAPEDYDLMRDLGITDYDFIDDFGNPFLHVDASAGTFVAGENFGLVVAGLNTSETSKPLPGFAPVRVEDVESVKAAGRVMKDFRLEVEAGATTTRPTSLSPWDALGGGDFTRQVWSPYSADAIQRVNIAYPDLTGPARQVALNVVLTGTAVYAAFSAVLFLLIRLMVYGPLRRYSGFALRIAEGENVRMPMHQRDEMGDLARALNSMADVLENKATIDPLTHLYNMRHLGDHLDSLVAEAQRGGQPLSVVVGDLDRFKQVNDIHGHLCGDEVLQAVGEAMLKWGGSHYTCWRQGGDEFVLALPGKTALEAAAEAERLERMIDSIVVETDDGPVFPSISTGVASLSADGETAGSLIGVADRRMYEAKALKYGVRDSLALSA